MDWRRTILGIGAWNIAGRFGWLTRGGFRCVLFHDVSPDRSPFTEGLGVRMHPEVFESRIDYLAREYAPCGFDEFAAGHASDRSAKARLLVTFDDAYASVARVAAKVLRNRDVPGLFFVNSGLIGNRDLSLDNLLCYVWNSLGAGVIRDAARRFDEAAGIAFQSLDDAVIAFASRLDLGTRSLFRETLLERTSLDSAALAREAKLYLSEEDVAALPADGIEVGNHTLSHTWCRGLKENELEIEVGRNQTQLHALCGQPVCTFSVPYGSRSDLSPELADYLRRTGHRGCFLVHGLPNSSPVDLDAIDRVSLKGGLDRDTYLEVEVLPRLRRVVAALRAARVSA